MFSDDRRRHSPHRNVRSTILQSRSYILIVDMKVKSSRVEEFQKAGSMSSPAPTKRVRRERQSKRNKNKERFDEDSDLRTNQRVFKDLDFRRCDQKRRFECIISLDSAGLIDVGNISLMSDGTVISIQTKSELETSDGASVIHKVDLSFPAPKWCDVRSLRGVLLPGGRLMLTAPYAADKPPLRRLRNIVSLPVGRATRPTSADASQLSVVF